MWDINVSIGSGTDNAALVSFLSGAKPADGLRLWQYHYYSADIGWRIDQYRTRNVQGEGHLHGLLSPLHLPYVQLLTKDSMCSFPPTYHYRGDFHEGNWILHVPHVHDSVRSLWIERRGEIQYSSTQPQCRY